MVSVKKAAGKLQSDFSAISLHFKWVGVNKSLSTNQKSEAADVFSAEHKSLSASKKLFDTKNEHFKKLTAVRNQARAFWIANSLPFTDDAIRLFPQNKVTYVTDKFAEFHTLIKEAEALLEQDYAQIKDNAYQRLGSLYNENDYPSTLLGSFDVSWDFHNVSPPEYLMELNPALYEEQKRRMTAKFEQAVMLAEQSFIEEFQKMIVHLADKLQGKDDGKEKIFHASSVDNVKDFFKRFKELNLNSNDELDKLVTQAEGLLSGVNAKDLRDNAQMKIALHDKLNVVGTQLTGMLEAKPRRKVIRANAQAVVNGSTTE